MPASNAIAKEAWASVSAAARTRAVAEARFALSAANDVHNAPMAI